MEELTQLKLSLWFNTKELAKLEELAKKSDFDTESYIQTIIDKELRE